MNDVPPSQEPSDDDIDTLYRRASALDPSRPSAGVSRAILAHAELVSAERALQRDPAGTGTTASRRRTPRAWWRPAILGTLAAAALAGFLVLPNVRTTLLAPPTYPRVSLPKIASTPAVEPSSSARQSLQANTPTSPAAAPPPVPASSAAAISPRTPSPAAVASPARASSAPAPSAQSFAATTQDQSRTEALASGVASQLAGPTAAVKATPAADAKNLQTPTEDVTVTAQRRTKQDEAATSAPIASAAANLAEIVTTAAPPDPEIGSPAALHRAAETGDLKRLQASLDQLTDLNSRDESGRTALLLATLNGQTKAVKMLLAHGADPNSAATNGMTPLQAATQGGKSAIIDALKRAGAH